MNTEYTKEAHNKALQKAIAEAVKKNDRQMVFCPLIKDTCNTHCECWNPASVHNIEFIPEDAYDALLPYIKGGYCSNHALHGMVV